MVSSSAEIYTSKFLSKGSTAAQVNVFAGAQDIQMDNSIVIAGQVVSEHSR